MPLSVPVDEIPSEDAIVRFASPMLPSALSERVTFKESMAGMIAEES